MPSSGSLPSKPAQTHTLEKLKIKENMRGTCKQLSDISIRPSLLCALILVCPDLRWSLVLSVSNKTSCDLSREEVCPTESTRDRLDFFFVPLCFRPRFLLAFNARLSLSIQRNKHIHILALATTNTRDFRLTSSLIAFIVTAAATSVL